MEQKLLKSKQGRPPQESERGPYAVVDERCEDTTLEPSMKDLFITASLFVTKYYSGQFCYFLTLDSQYGFTTPDNFATF